MGLIQKIEQVFGKKPMADQTQQQEQPIMVTEEVQPGAQAPIVAATPQQDVPTQPVVPQAPSRQDVPDTADAPTPPVDEEETTQPKKEDRSAFNCPDCGGEGLKNGNDPYQLCPTCNGTGKA
jgi:hypothetical protein